MEKRTVERKQSCARFASVLLIRGEHHRRDEKGKYVGGKAISCEQAICISPKAGGGLLKPR